MSLFLKGRKLEKQGLNSKYSYRSLPLAKSHLVKVTAHFTVFKFYKVWIFRMQTWIELYLYFSEKFSAIFQAVYNSIHIALIDSNLNISIEEFINKLMPERDISSIEYKNVVLMLKDLYVKCNFLMEFLKR